MPQIKGPALFLAHFVRNIPLYNTVKNITQWPKDLGFIGVQIPASDSRLIDLDKAAESKQYCDDLKGRCSGLAITELATHQIGQLVAVHPAYDVQFDTFAPKELHGHPQERTEWAMAQMVKAMRASHNLGLHVMPTFSGAFLWHTIYPCPHRPAGLVELGFHEVPKPWLPLLAKAEEYG